MRVILGAATTDPPTRAATLDEGLNRLGQLTEDLFNALPVAGIGLAVFAGFILVAIVLRKSVRRYAQAQRKNRSLALALGRLSFGAILIVGFLVACVIVFPNFTPTGLLTSLGLGSLILGLAFKDVLQNYLAGILLLLAEPFRSGDQIIFGEFEGTVEDVQPRATFVRTYDGRRAIIPNAELFTRPLTVNTAFERRRVEYDIGIGYGDRIEDAKRLILDAIRDTGSALDDPPAEVLTFELAPSSVVLRVRWWIKPPHMRELVDARDQVLAAMKSKLQAHGIDLPFPTQQILFHDQTESSDGDRGQQREGWPARPEKPPPARAGIAVALQQVIHRGPGSEK